MLIGSRIIGQKRQADKAILESANSHSVSRKKGPPQYFKRSLPCKLENCCQPGEKSKDDLHIRLYFPWRREGGGCSGGDVCMQWICTIARTVHIYFVPSVWDRNIGSSTIPWQDRVFKRVILDFPLSLHSSAISWASPFATPQHRAPLPAASKRNVSE